MQIHKIQGVFEIRELKSDSTQYWKPLLSCFRCEVADEHEEKRTFE